MAEKKHLLLATSLMTLFASQAFADITPEQVWEDIQSKAEHAGFEISTANTLREKTALTKRETIARNGDELSNLTLFLGDLSFRDLGDGRVEILALDPVRGAYWNSSLQDSLKADFKMSGDALEVIASGSPGEIIYEYSSDSAQALIHGTYGGSSDVAFDGSLDLSGLQGAIVAASSETKGVFIFDTHSKAISVGFNATENLPHEVFHYSGHAKLQDFDLLQKLFFEQEPMENPHQDSKMAAGQIHDLDFKEVLSYASSLWDFSMSTDEPAQKFTASGGSGASESQMAMTLEGFSTQAQTKDIYISAQTDPEMMPSASISIDTFSFDLGAPFPSSYTDTTVSSDIDMGLLLSGLEFNDDLWDAVDPMGFFDHSPMSLNIDAGGRVEIPISSHPEMLPIVPKSLSLNTFDLKGLGVDMTASGGVSAVSSDQPAEPGMMPLLAGQFYLQASGIDDLLTSFSKSGIFPEQDLYMFAFMLNSFTIMDDDGTRRAKVTFSDDGEIYVNEERAR